jgi:uncharacterized iron-regulated membrane protein
MKVTALRQRHHGAGRTRVGVVLHRWHRRLGVLASVFLIWLAASGIVLNEAASLQLDHLRIGWPWLMHWYGLRAEPPANGWQKGGHWLAEVNDEAVFDGKVLQPSVHAPLGLAEAGGLFYVGTADSLVLLKADGSRVDTLHAPPLPVTQIRRIGNAGDRVAIQDLDVFVSADGEDWGSAAAADAQWSMPAPLADSQRQAVASLARPSLPLTRIMADAHSGRLFGRLGPTVINTAGVIAIVLAISGLWMWRRAAVRQRHQLRSQA